MQQQYRLMETERNGEYPLGNKIAKAKGMIAGSGKPLSSHDGRSPTIRSQVTSSQNPSKPPTKQHNCNGSSDPPSPPPASPSSVPSYTSDGPTKTSPSVPQSQRTSTCSENTPKRAPTSTIQGNRNGSPNPPSPPPASSPSRSSGHPLPAGHTPDNPTKIPPSAQITSSKNTSGPPPTLARQDDCRQPRPVSCTSDSLTKTSPSVSQPQVTSSQNTSKPAPAPAAPDNCKASSNPPSPPPPSPFPTGHTSDNPTKISPSVLQPQTTSSKNTSKPPPTPAKQDNCGQPRPVSRISGDPTKKSPSVPQPQVTISENSSKPSPKPDNGGGTSEKQPRPVILIAVMGVTGTGKSNFIRTLTGDENIVVGKRLKSCTKRVHQSSTFRLDEDTIQMVDTPGFSDDMISDGSTLGLIAEWMMNIPDTQKLGGILYFHRITDTRMDGGALRCMKLFEDICGPAFLQNTALITTMWDKYPEDFNETVETERELINQYWHHYLTAHRGLDGAESVNILFDRNNDAVKLDTDITCRGPFTGAMYARSDNTKEMFEKILREIIRKEPVIPELQKELARDGSLGKTTAGKRLKKALNKEKPHIQSMEGNVNEADKRDVAPGVGQGELANKLEVEAAPAEHASDTQPFFPPRSPSRTERFSKRKWFNRLSK